MKRVGALLVAALLASACSSKVAPSPGAPGQPPELAPKAEAVPSAAPATSEPSGAQTESTAPAERQFGAAPKLPGEPVSVADVLATPDPHVGKTIKCEGKVARVCQAAGCWLELQPQAGGEGLRVPMAAHAFFIPQDAIGHVAVVEGELKRRELPDAQKAHYAGEGMKAMGPLALEATSVLLR